MARGNLLLLLALPAVLARHATKNIRIAPDEQDSEDAVASQEYGVGFSMTGTGLSVHDDFRLGRAATKLMMLPGPQTLAAWTKDGTACVLRGSTFAHEAAMMANGSGSSKSRSTASTCLMSSDHHRTPACRCVSTVMLRLAGTSLTRRLTTPPPMAPSP
jgi:hypothetical protein